MTTGQRSGPGGVERTAPARTAWPDAVRTALTLLVVAHHCAIVYSHVPAFAYYEAPADDSAVLLDLLVVVNQAWFMGAFFLISGWFVPGSVDRHGVAGFIRGRLLRLGVPFLGYVLALRPLYVLAGSWGEPGALGRALTALDVGPLWFVLVLLVFSLLYAGLRARGPRMVAEAGSSAPGPVPGVCVITGIGVVIGGASWLWWIVVPAGTFWPVLPSAAYLPQYALCFAVGVVGGRRGWFARLRARTGWACGALAVVAGLGWLVTVASGDPASTGGGTALSAVTAVLNGVFTMSLIVAVLVFARARLDRSGRVARFLSTNAYAVFVLHAPIVAWLGVALAGLAAPAAVKALLLLGLSVALCWTAAALVRLIPAVRRVL